MPNSDDRNALFLFYYKVGQFCLITKWDKVCYKVGQLFYTKWGGYFKMGKIYHNVGQVLQIGQVLQSGVGITKWGRYYKVGQVLQIGVGITKCCRYYKVLQDISKEKEILILNLVRGCHTGLITNKNLVNFRRSCDP